MYSCEIWANADPFCARADPCIRNWSDIHACIRNVLDITLRMGNYTTMLPIYQLAVADA